MGYLFYNNWYYSATVFPSMEDHLDPVNNAYFTGLHQEIKNIEDALGLTPMGTFATVKARLNNLDQQIDDLEQSITAFTDRGEPLGWDLEQGAMTKDEYWHSWDISSIVPVGTKAVVVKINLRDTAVDTLVAIRNAEVGGFTGAFCIFTQVVNQWISSIFVIPCGTTRTLAYWTTNRAIAYIQLFITGWWA